jgi:pimeloyl-ACP methyl ester carboxylesterase
VSASTDRRLRLSGGTELSYVTAGEAENPTLLLLHGFPSSARMFRAVIPGLARVAHVVAPDLQIAMQDPELVSGLILQNANAHRTGLGPVWDTVLAAWADPTPENEAAATPDLTFDFIREQYVDGLPDEVAARIDGEPWVEDWRIMGLPGRMDTQQALIHDYRSHAARFEAIAEYLEKWQPPALMLWGRHDPYFDIAETLSWMQDLPRMEAHIFDGGHFLLETHAEAALALMVDFTQRAAA